MYYGDRTNNTGKGTSGLPFLGPKRLIYADARSGGSLTAVDFEDWESTSAGRNVIFLWPNGDQLNDTAEGYIDDFHFLAPTRQPGPAGHVYGDYGRLGGSDWRRRGPVEPIGPGRAQGRTGKSRFDDC